MTKLALVVVDLQEDFLPPNGSLRVPGGRDVIAPICDLLEHHWLAVVLTQDWHPATHCLFASNHNVSPFSEVSFQHPLGEKDAVGAVQTQKQVVWPVHCVQGLEGACIQQDILTAFKSIREDIPTTIVKKGYLQDREYYLCFCDCWKLHKTEIADFLRTNLITDIVFVGLAYDFCVLNSAVNGQELGFTCHVLRDYCRSVYSANMEETEARYRAAGVRIHCSSDELFEQLC